VSLVTEYGADLAYVHDAGFSEYALGAAPGLLRLLRQSGVRSGLVTDLGCGSGRWARELNLAGYEVFGVDRSAAFIRMARRIAPGARFVVGSLASVELPALDGHFDRGVCQLLLRSDAARRSLQACVRGFASGRRLRLRRGGAGAHPGGGRAAVVLGQDWAILVETEGDIARATLTRRILCFRQVGRLYRRSEEVHRLRLFEPTEVLSLLSHAGFEARPVAGYGRFRLPRGIAGFVAVKR